MSITVLGCDFDSSANPVADYAQCGISRGNFETASVISSSTDIGQTLIREVYKSQHESHQIQPLERITRRLKWPWLNCSNSKPFQGPRDSLHRLFFFACSHFITFLAVTSQMSFRYLRPATCKYGRCPLAPGYYTDGCSAGNEEGRRWYTAIA